MNIYAQTKVQNNMQIVITLAIIASLFNIALCGWNANFRDSCNPAKYHEDNSGYCVDFFQGWWNGGAYAMDYSNQPRCYKGETSHTCKCNDCGTADTQCKDWRCDDDNGFEIDGKCYKKKDTGALEEVSVEIYDYCYKGVGVCSICPNKGERRVGCKRKSPGECQKCTNTQEGFYFDTVGSCNLAKCSVPAPGQYIQTACTQGDNTVIKSCSEHPSNKQSPPNQYYCPGNNELKAIAANSHVNPGFTDYICNDGYYRDFDLCRACPPGTCCANQAKHDCPEHYFASGNANSKCTKCNMKCTGIDAGKLRRRCPKNSIQNSERCISCGLCGEWPTTGYNCVLEPLDFEDKPSTCCPC
jgi:hypothetical protein